MLKIEDLLSLDTFPSLSEISFSLYKEFCEKVLLARRFDYEFLEDEINKKIMSVACKLSIIIPVYNSEALLPRCLDSLIFQTIDKDLFEVLLINDGSTDNSLKICREYAKTFPFVKVISQENMGVSAARNTGIKNASGEYLLFLDADDTISTNTLENIYEFFEAHSSEIDILTYPIYYDTDTKSVCDHFRYQYLTEDGIYDTEEFPYICQTTMNVCVKKQNELILFNEDMHVHEDQDFICRYILLKNKIGFVKDAEYHYLQHDESVAHQKLNPLYSFDTLTNFEKLLIEHPESKYLKALFLYDFNWRLRSDQLFPYHLPENEFDAAKERIINILKTIDPLMIMVHPSIDYFHRYYILELIKLPVTLLLNEKDLCLYHKGLILHRISEIEIIISKINIKNGHLKMNGYLKDVSFAFSRKPLLYAVMDGEQKEIDLFASSANHYRSRIETNCFWGFYFDEEISDIENLKFEVNIGGFSYNTKFYFMYLSPIDSSSSRKGFAKENISVELKEDNHFEIKKVSAQEELVFNKKMNRDCPAKYLRYKGEITENSRIWLYYDCKGVSIDNGLLQFIHDIKISDGIEKYFIWNNPIEELPDIVDDEIRKYIVGFGSDEHIELLFNAEKIITAYVENKNIYPFSPDEFHFVADKLTAEIIYLQHGILHVKTPWKYTPENSRFDKIVISSYFEEENMKGNYRVTDDMFIRAGMPRFEQFDMSKKPGRRILFAPSWRNYLIRSVDDKWVVTEDVFLSSNYYKNIEQALNNPKLDEILEKNDLYIDFKIHPIFKCYKNHFEFKSNRINLVDEQMREEDYALFITDFSSFVFDFVYLGRRIIYFVPDYLEFIAGCNSYRELDLQYDKAFGPLVKTAEELCWEIERAVDADFKPEPEICERIDNFFLPINNSTDKIYNEIKNF